MIQIAVIEIALPTGFIETTLRYRLKNKLIRDIIFLDKERPNERTIAQYSKIINRAAKET